MACLRPGQRERAAQRGNPDGPGWTPRSSPRPRADCGTPAPASGKRTGCRPRATSAGHPRPKPNFPRIVSGQVVRAPNFCQVACVGGLAFAVTARLARRGIRRNSDAASQPPHRESVRTWEDSGRARGNALEPVESPADPRRVHSPNCEAEPPRVGTRTALPSNPPGRSTGTLCRHTVKSGGFGASGLAHLVAGR